MNYLCLQSKTFIESTLNGKHKHRNGVLFNSIKIETTSVKRAIPFLALLKENRRKKNILIMICLFVFISKIRREKSETVVNKINMRGEDMRGDQTRRTGR